MAGKIGPGKIHPGQQEDLGSKASTGLFPGFTRVVL